MENTTTNIVTIPIDTTGLVTYNKRKVKAKHILLNFMKDRIILHVNKKTHGYDMWTTLTNLLQTSNANKKMELQ